MAPRPFVAGLARPLLRRPGLAACLSAVLAAAGCEHDLDRAKRLAAAGDDAGAVEVCTQFLRDETDPEDRYVGCLRRVTHLMALKRYDEAVADFTELIDLAPEVADLFPVGAREVADHHRLRALAYAETGRPGLAAADFRAADRLDPRD